MRLKKFIVSGVKGLTEKDAVVFNQEETPEGCTSLVLDMSTAWGYLHQMQSEMLSAVLSCKYIEPIVKFTCVFDNDKEDDLIYSVEVHKDDFYFNEWVYYGSEHEIKLLIHSAMPESSGDPVSQYQPLSPYRRTHVELPGLVGFQLCRGDRLTLDTVSSLKRITVRGEEYTIPDELYAISSFIRDSYIITYCGNRTVVEDNWKVISWRDRNDV